MLMTGFISPLAINAEETSSASSADRTGRIAPEHSTFYNSDDAGLQNVYDRQLCTNVNQIVTCNGISMTVTEAAYDDSRLVIGYWIEAENEKNYQPHFGMDMFDIIDFGLIPGAPFKEPDPKDFYNLRINGEGYYVPSYGYTNNTDNDKPRKEVFWAEFAIGSEYPSSTGFSNIAESLPDKCNIHFRVNEMRRTDEFGRREEVEGLWEFNFEVSKIPSATKVFETEKPSFVNNNNTTLTVTRASVSPMTCSVYLESDKSVKNSGTDSNITDSKFVLTENDNSFRNGFTDDKGNPLKCREFLSNDHEKDGEYKTYYRIKFDPPEDIPDYLMLKETNGKEINLKIPLIGTEPPADASISNNSDDVGIQNVFEIIKFLLTLVKRIIL